MATHHSTVENPSDFSLPEASGFCYTFTMRLLCGIAMGLILPLSVSWADAPYGIKPGDSRESVVEKLGSPTGSIESGGKTILFYREGEVELQDGVAVEVKLMTPEEMVEKEAKQELIRLATIENHEIQSIRRKEIGERLRQDKVSDPRFLASSPGYRLNFWRQFKSLYPEVDVTEEIAVATTDFQQWLKDDAENRRIAAAEARALEAERRAAEAEREAETERRRAERNYQRPYYTGNPYYYYRGYSSRGGGITVVYNKGGTSRPLVPPATNQPPPAQTLPRPSQKPQPKPNSVVSPRRPRVTK